MDTFILFAAIFSVFGWGIYRLLRYTAESVGDESPLKTTVVYGYTGWDFLKWAQTPPLLEGCVIFTWLCWVLVINLSTATNFWHYVLTVCTFALAASLYYLLIKLIKLERKFWTIIQDTYLTLDPIHQSMTVQRAGRLTILTADTVAAIEMYFTSQGRFSYVHYRFLNREGKSTFFYNYGKGLGFAIDDYFKGIPASVVQHNYPFDSVLLS